MGREVIDPLLIPMDSLLPTQLVPPSLPVVTSALTTVIPFLITRLRALILSRCLRGLYLDLKA
jgi:hypothetical protein